MGHLSDPALLHGKCRDKRGRASVLISNCRIIEMTWAKLNLEPDMRENKESDIILKLRGHERQPLGDSTEEE